jgi:hypothetical protein
MIALCGILKPIIHKSLPRITENARGTQLSIICPPSKYPLVAPTSRSYLTCRDAENRHVLECCNFPWDALHLLFGPCSHTSLSGPLGPFRAALDNIPQLGITVESPAKDFTASGECEDVLLTKGEGINETGQVWVIGRGMLGVRCCAKTSESQAPF